MDTAQLLEEFSQEQIDSLDPYNYDVEAISIDYPAPYPLREYRHEHIILTSIVNGQFKQAKEQQTKAALSITDLMQYATGNFFNLKLSEFSKLENN